MRSKYKEPLKDDFVSIHELRIRNKNKIQSNHFKTEQKKEPQYYQQYEKEVKVSRWEKLKTYLMNFTEDLIFEPIEEEEEYSKPDMANRNLMLASESIHGTQYSNIQIAMVDENIKLSDVLNSALRHLEQFLKNIQIGLILDAETLEFNENTCNNYIHSQRPSEKEITLIEKIKVITERIKVSTNQRFSIKNLINIFQIKTNKVTPLKDFKNAQNLNEQVENDP